MAIQPSDEVLQRFGVGMVAPLGGRLNLHWLVESRHERLVLRRWAQSLGEIEYELHLLSRIAALGWPVAPAFEGPIKLEGYFWSLAPFLSGEPASAKNSVAEQRERGRLLAAFHADLAQLCEFGQRGTWRRCEDILSDPMLDRVLTEHEQEHAEEIYALRWHLDRARKRVTDLQLHDRPGMVIHGDFTQWNLLFKDGHLSGILDFELAHWDHRIGDFALSWRGKYDDVIHGYADLSLLEPDEWALITPMWWAFLIDGACRDLATGTRDDGWTMKQLFRRSPLMGPDAVEFR